jgi:flagellum-specific ATP synthase
MALDLSRYQQAVRRTDALRLNGRVSQVVGVIVESVGPASRVGEICHIHTGRNRPPLPAEVVGFRGNRVLLMPLSGMGDIAHGNEVIATGRPLSVRADRSLLGRVLDGLGRPMDGGPVIVGGADLCVQQSPPHPLRRQRIRGVLPLGVRAIDAFLTCGKGQRMGIFSGSGVGKSTLLAMMARNSTADVNVIGLVGERGREVREFMEGNLGEEGMRRSVVIVATSDQPAIQRLKAAFVATAVAEHFRDQGLDVLLTMDSVTRLAWAQREIGLAIGEPPTTRGYTPSVFAMLPQLLERSGAGEKGTITGLYTVLVEGDDLNEPVADTVRGILDGHIVLSRALAERNHYPAIDILASISRLMPQITSPEHRHAAGLLRRLTATYRSAEDLIRIGAYAEGANPEIDRAKAMMGPIEEFLIQSAEERCDWTHTLARLRELAESAGGNGPRPEKSDAKAADPAQDGKGSGQDHRRSP